MQTLIVERIDQGICLITLSRAERLNAMNSAMVEELIAALDDVESASEVKVVVLTGSGRGFCSGWDIKDSGESLSGGTVQAGMATQRRTATLIRRFRSSTLPIIAAVNGPAVGGGFALALAADIRIMARSAVLIPMFIRLGISGGELGTSWLLPRLVGVAQTMELLLTGDPTDASRALDMGLVNSVVEDDIVIDAAVDLARRISKHAPFAIAMTKEVIWANTEIPSLHAAIELENRSQILATQTHDHREALDAWRARRAPLYRNT
jgi:enoyl-CoA hydratase